MAFNAILYIGPNYKGHRGGIGAVLEIYSKHINAFKFIASYDGNYTPLRNFWLFCLSIYKLFFFLLFDKEIRIVHIHGSSKGSFYRKFILFLIAKFIFQKKVVYHMHGGGFDRFFDNSGKGLSRCISTLINKADAVVCLSKSWEKYFRNNFNPKVLRIINNPIEMVDELRFEKLEVVTFLFLGKICDQKGVFDLLHIIKDNKQAYVGKAIFRFGGNGEIERLRDFISANDLADLVFFEGWVSGLIKHSLLSTANVYILPSYIEGLPVSILEAMNYGLPVISTEVGGIPEIVSNDINGFLITPGDTLAIKNAIDYFITHPYYILKMGHKARLTSLAFDIKAIIPNLERLYWNVLV